MEQTIYKLKLHEVLKIEEEDTRILRVAGGWLYQTRSDFGWVQTFVPLHPEFKTSKKTSPQKPSL